MLLSYLSFIFKSSGAYCYAPSPKCNCSDFAEKIDKVVLPSHRIILVEGLHLLCDKGEWAQAYALFDRRILLEVNIGVEIYDAVVYWSLCLERWAARSFIMRVLLSSPSFYLVLNF